MQKVAIELNDSGEGHVVARNSFLETLAFVLLVPLPFLIPLFLIPGANFPFQFSKMMLVSLAVLVAFALWLVARLKDGHFVLPKSTVLVAGLSVAVVALISALSSGAVKAGLVGQALEIGTVASLGVLFLLMTLVPLLFRSKDRIFYAYLCFFASFCIIALFHVSRLFFGVGFLSFGLFTEATSNVVGSWNDLAVFFGIGTVLSLITLELISLSKFFKVLAYIALAVSLLFLAIVNFGPVWYVMALFSLIFLIYVVSFDKSESAGATAGEHTVLRKVPMTSLVVFLISLVFILGGGPIGTSISNKLGIAQLEARPSWTATLSIAKDVLVKDPLLGVGPNRFATAWVLHKPDGINPTVFWNTDFNFGIGFVPSFLVTTGILGIIAWLVFLGLFLFVGFKTILSAAGDRVSRYLVSSSFLVSLFLWIISIFYVPGTSVLVLTFFFSGLFIASLCQAGVIHSKNISFAEDPKKGFVSVLALILLLITTVTAGYLFIQKYIGAVYFQKGIVVYNTKGDLDGAERSIIKATTLDNSAPYFRALTQIDMLRMSNLLSQNPKDVSADTVRTQFQGLLSAALNHAQQAVSIDSVDYQNWFSLGQVYEGVVPLKIENAYESARNAYLQAMTLNPKSPALLLTLARLEATHEDNAKAKDYIAQALAQKNNYTDAIFLLAQIQVSEGNLKDAIASVEAASLLAPNDSGVSFQLGLLRYNNKEYQGAVNAFNQALKINPVYANAKYFLGLSLYRLGKTADAIQQFKDLKVTNPDSQEVDLILKNLLAGLSPFTDAKPPIDSQPEKRATPPVTEKESKTTTKKAPATSGDTIDEL